MANERLMFKTGGTQVVLSPQALTMRWAMPGLAPELSPSEQIALFFDGEQAPTVWDLKSKDVHNLSGSK